ncbi:MAG: hypothetical protein A3F13_00980 [Gammaproteobacteria bacterium RIFCSPHIGHO2_12_FULL_40_19]|nr:MAG: hypothetical protein A3F13_00980 [Gammaproteobacteria bacterium RIFCSPHIGHO2_12_FULL_40_19]
MNFDLEDIFPEDISDETAFYLTEFVEKLSLMVNDRYFTAARRYFNNCRPSSSDEPVFLTRKNNIDDSF